MKKIIVVFMVFILSFNVYASSLDAFFYDSPILNYEGTFQFEDFDSIGDIDNFADSYSLTGALTGGSLVLYLIYTAYAGGVFASGIKQFDPSSAKITYDKYWTDKINRMTDSQIASICGVDPTSISSLLKSVIETGVVTLQQRNILYPMVQEYYNKVIPVSSMVDTSTVNLGEGFEYDGVKYPTGDALMRKMGYPCWSNVEGWNGSEFDKVVKNMSARGFKYVHLTYTMWYDRYYTYTKKTYAEPFFIFTDNVAPSLVLTPTVEIGYESSRYRLTGSQIKVDGMMATYSVIREGSSLVKNLTIGTSDNYAWTGKNHSYAWPVTILTSASIDGLSEMVVNPALPNGESSDLSVVLPNSAYGVDYIKDIVNAGTNSDVLGGTVVDDTVITPPVTDVPDVSGIMGLLGQLVGAVEGLVDGILEGLKDLFIPQEGYFENLFNNLKNKFNDKMPFIPVISGFFDDLKDTDYNTQRPSFTITLPGSWGGTTHEIINLDMFADYRSMILLIIRGIAWFLFLKRLMNKLPKIIY